ncbi:MAG: hypothetical protein LUG90_16805 [Clostridiaceae bacterium]|nr:hypothetical protein [Clostridiaceae bacterium]
MITAEFKDFEEMMVFAKNLVSTVETQDKPPVQQAAPAMTQPVQQTAPVAPPPVQAQQMAPVTPPPVQAQQVTPVTPPPVQQAPVQTTAPSYTADDLARAAMTLMDSGRQGELISLLAQFGTDALTQLPPEQYGAFATALRGLGAPI